MAHRKPGPLSDPRTNASTQKNRTQKGPKSAGHHEQRRLRTAKPRREPRGLVGSRFGLLVSAMTGLWPSPVPNRIDLSIPLAF